MSINILYAPEIEDLKQFLTERGSKDFFFRFIRKRESFIGSTESIAFIEKFIEKYQITEDADEVFYEL